MSPSPWGICCSVSQWPAFMFSSVSSSGEARARERPTTLAALQPKRRFLGVADLPRLLLRLHAGADRHRRRRLVLGRFLHRLPDPASLAALVLPHLAVSAL